MNATRRLTQKDWEILSEVLSMVLAGPWGEGDSEGSEFSRDDVEDTWAKVVERIKGHQS